MSTGVELVIRTTDGSFEGRLVVPTTCGKEVMHETVKLWFGMLSDALWIATRVPVPTPADVPAVRP